jgi:hypothetical protein
MINIILGYVDLFLQVGMLIYLFAHSIILIKRNLNTVIPVFFCFATLGFLISDIYWIAHTLMLPGKRIPFAANLIGENALFLLSTSILLTIFKKEEIKPGIETLLTAAFAAAITALWMSWLGEWFKDVISGAAYGYFLTVVVRSVKASGVLTKKERNIAAIVSFILIASQYAILLIQRPISTYLEYFADVLAFLGIIYCVCKTASAFKEGREGNYLITASLMCFAWITNTMYMTSSPLYEIASIIWTFTMPFILIAVQRKAAES